MADFTPNYNLKKPLRTEYYNVADANGNSDIVDTQLKAVNDRVDLVESEVDALELGKVDKVVGKQLSDENYTLIEKNKVANLPDDTNAQLAEKANKVNGEWIEATLINGATGSVKYRKNDMGLVEIDINIANAINGITHFTLPAGYKPSEVIWWVLRNETSTTITMGYLSTTGSFAQNTSSTQIRGRLVYGV